ncbi:ComEC/Rec2 family competence protein [Candidatus Dependentiae bacterium]|nr:ComEC/Rec2 family competence protein [Candidatus Dependentiae bacterium]
MNIQVDTYYLAQRSFFAEQPPLVYLFVAHLIGIILYEHTTPTCLYALVFITFLTGVLFLMRRTPWLGASCMLTLCGTLGFIFVQHQYDNFCAFYTMTKSKSWQVHACVETIEKIQHPFYDSEITLTTHGLENESGARIEIKKQCRWYCKIKKGSLKSGDIITLDNVVFHQPTSKSFLQYLCKEDIQATLFGNFATHSLAQHNQQGLSCHLLQSIKNQKIATLGSSMRLRTKALLDSLFFGKKPTNKHLFSATRQLFARWGLSHYLARSGLHLVVFVAIWSILLRIIPLRFALKELLFVVLVVAYALLSCSSISFLRALWMFIMYKSCNLARLRINVLNVVVLVAYATLILNPLQLFFLDFQLSFLLTYALGWISSARLRNPA